MRTTRRTVLGALPAAALAGRVHAQGGEAGVPMSTVFGRPWTSAVLGSATGLRFALDTQAQLFRADAATVRQAGLTPLPFQAGRARLHRAELLGIGGAYGFRNIEVAEFGDGGDGVLFHGSVPLLQDLPSLYDFPASRFIPGWRPDAGFASARMPSAGGGRETWMRLPVVEVTIDGVTLRLRVATQSSYAVSLNAFGVSRHGLWDRWSGGYDRAAWFQRAEARGHSVRIRRAERLRFMDWTLPGAVIGLANPEGETGRHPGVDGTIGMDVLGRFALGFEPDGWRVRARPSDALGRAFRHDRSGLQVARRDGAWTVVKVDAGSPAEIAGARVGDRVPNLTGRGADGLEWATSDPDANVFELSVMRDGAAVPLVLALRDRL